MSRSNARGATILALAATTLLGACTDMYLDRRDSVSFAAGDAVAANKVTPFAGTGTSSVKYDPVLVQPAPK